MRKAIKSNAGKVEKIRQALANAIDADDLFLLQEALDISVKTRDNSFSMANLLAEAKTPNCSFDFFTSDAFYLAAEAIEKASEQNATKTLGYLLLSTPHEFKMLQRSMRAATVNHHVEALKQLVDYIGKLDDSLFIKHMTTMFMDKGSPLPLPLLAAACVKEREQNK